MMLPIKLFNDETKKAKKLSNDGTKNVTKYMHTVFKCLKS